MDKSSIMEWLDITSNQKKVIDFIKKQITEANINEFSSKEESLIEKHLINDQEKGKWYSSTDIKHLLEKLHSRKLSVIKIGKALNKLGFMRKRSCGTSYYLACFKLSK